jgi:hypothetical protein
MRQLETANCIETREDRMKKTAETATGHAGSTDLPMGL